MSVSKGNAKCTLIKQWDVLLTSRDENLNEVLHRDGHNLICLKLCMGSHHQSVLLALVLSYKSEKKYN